jgi:hypothetical protein
MPEFALPEFTRSLRALAVPSAPDSDHAIAFGPLLQARTLAHRALSMEAQLAAFDAARLDRAVRAAINALAERKHKMSAPDRRSLEAELELLAEPVFAALKSMGAAAELAKLARPDDRRVAWDVWVETVRALFSAADDWWADAIPALADSRGRRGALWRRVIGVAR